jgi:predicted CXXCH cytochrome family protein
MTSSKDVAHLVRLVLLITVGILVFLGFRTLAVPPGFGQYGHYRGPAINEIRAHQISFAGQDVCEACHSEQHDKAAAGPHSGVRCEACHGSQARHASDPGIKPVLPKTPELCVQCHEAGAAKPKKFPQVVSAQHFAALDCKTCHQPHNPKEGI